MIKIYTDINQVKKSGKELIESPYDKCSLIEAEYIKEFGINSLYKIQEDIAIKIDKCTVDSRHNIISPFTNAPIRVDQLSDGSRTAEFIYVYTQLGNTDEIIDITSCGPNALKYIFEKYKECSLNVLLTHLEIPKDIIFDFEYNGYLLHNTSEIFE